MMPYNFDVELKAIRSRTKRSAGASLALHVALFLWLYMVPGISPEAEALVEISWIESAPSPPAATNIEPPPEKIVVETRSVRKIPEYFVREAEKAEVTAEPQVSRAYEDKMNRRLASLQRDAAAKRTQIATLAAPNVMNNPTLAAIPAGDVQAGVPGELTRQEKAAVRPEILRRTPVNAARPALAQAKPQQVEAAPEPAEPSESTARRTLAGASLSGPVADRPLVSYSTPVYPKWAKREGVEGAVTIYFVVLPDGQVKKNAVVEKTSGFEDFDSNAVDALLSWRFEPLGANRIGEQWGRITFHYRLSNAGLN
jgi:TonB family protein